MQEVQGRIVVSNQQYYLLTEDGEFLISDRDARSLSLEFMIGKIISGLYASARLHTNDKYYRKIVPGSINITD